ncbi:MAG: hypothetical protein DWQ35_21720 [Planctomycetota bacterium]|nr:MAG: hypothetical protein DWQ35_21720 [Planctomycetota bacterium]REK31621.1 MAG: hypothetical protein DWQ42_00025 [Planctomycetota bacterium]REK42376.1 MAG: hypothetical protein DWQ46_13620 [Planctomycetota bacterium]
MKPSQHRPIIDDGQTGQFATQEPLAIVIRKYAMEDLIATSSVRQAKKQLPQLPTDARRQLLDVHVTSL